MIGKLKGIVDTIADDHIIIDTGGVGYIVFCSGKTLTAIGAEGTAASLYIETHVREDHIHLYGFATESEKKWFELLTTVQGVGAKVGLAILTALGTDEITNAIAAQDKTTITRANGVGPKLAERIITELKSKVGTMTISAPVKISAKSGKVAPASNAKEDAISALTNLGIARIDAFVAVNKVANDDKKLEQIITEALKEVGR